MKMYQFEKDFDFHALGREIKRKRNIERRAKFENTDFQYFRHPALSANQRPTQRCNSQSGRIRAGRRSIWPNFLTGHRAPSCIWRTGASTPAWTFFSKSKEILTKYANDYELKAYLETQAAQQKEKIELMQRQLTLIESTIKVYYKPSHSARVKHFLSLYC